MGVLKDLDGNGDALEHALVHSGLTRLGDLLLDHHVGEGGERARAAAVAVYLKQLGVCAW